MSVLGPVQSRYREAVQKVKEIYGGKDLLKRYRFGAWSERVKEWWMTRVVMMTEMSWEVDEEVNQDKNGEADGMNLEVDSKDEVMHI